MSPLDHLLAMPSVGSLVDLAAFLQKLNMQRTPYPVNPATQGIKQTTGVLEVVRPMQELLRSAWMKILETCKSVAGISISWWVPCFATQIYVDD